MIDCKKLAEKMSYSYIIHRIAVPICPDESCAIPQLTQLAYYELGGNSLFAEVIGGAIVDGTCELCKFLTGHIEYGCRVEDGMR